MIKDIVVNLTGGHPQDFASAYAISLAAGFDAHIVGVGFIYEPVIPGSLLGNIPTDLIEAQRQENTRAAREAISGFESAAGAAGVSAETRTLDASVAGAPHLLGRQPPGGARHRGLTALAPGRQIDRHHRGHRRARQERRDHWHQHAPAY